MNSLFAANNFPSLTREVFGITFRHPAGLPPGYAPDGEHFNAFPGFSFVEIGPLTVLPQGNPIARSLFHRRKALGGSVDNKGVGNAIRHLHRTGARTLIMANLAPAYTHRATEDIVRDITTAFSMMYDFADLFVVDTFRPNCDGSVALQNIDILSEVLDSIFDIRYCYEDPKPVLVRVLPSISRAVLSEILGYMRLYGADGVIAGYNDYPLDLVRDIRSMTDGRFPVIACGGIDTPQKAAAVLDAGASLVQLSCGPRRVLKYLDACVREGVTPSVGKDDID